MHCIYCPRADYTDAAQVVKIQGTVKMDVLFDAEGRPAEIAIVDGLPCGLNKAAVDAVVQWKVTPAKDPSGKPAAIWTTIQVTFQLF